jgi:hypothetical protein
LDQSAGGAKEDNRGRKAVRLEAEPESSVVEPTGGIIVEPEEYAIGKANREALMH